MLPSSAKQPRASVQYYTLITVYFLVHYLHSDESRTIINHAGLQRNKDIPIAILINKYDVVTSVPSTTSAFDVLTLEDVRDAMGLDALQVGHIYLSGVLLLLSPRYPNAHD